mmetsp:Transcript_1510/g.3606  ORF Transcript_1510/g.3606 Transcript_1510/m.3606 type:complete len:708 (+) Transcript_1510:42-2165(+)
MKLLPLALLLTGAAINVAGAAVPRPLKARRERKEKAAVVAEQMNQMKQDGVDIVSNDKQSALLRSYELRKKKTRGILRKRQTSLSSILFPGVSPEEYASSEQIPIYVDLVESRKTQVPFEFYDLPTCPAPPKEKVKGYRKSLGNRLSGHNVKPGPYEIRVGEDKYCTPLCAVSIGGKKLKWMRQLVERQYRIHLMLDQLPVLMRSKELNYAVRGYPVGFKAPPSYTGLREDEYYLYNHLKFTISYLEDPSQFDGVRITGFDVHPVSYEHNIGDFKNIGDSIPSCNADVDVVNDPSTYLALRAGPTGEDVQALYSYEVRWEPSEVAWADRWDVYMIGSPDDGIHYFAIVNSLMIVLFLMGAVGTIMIRTLRKDIAGYNEMQTLEEAQEETGWKLVHGDVFRPPATSPMILSVSVGTGAQIATAFFLVLLCAVLRLVNPMKKGQALTAIVILYVLSGTVSGYVSSRIYKFCGASDWKANTLVTAVAFPGLLVGMFMVLNVFLGIAGAATHAHFVTVLLMFLLWLCLSTPLVMVGSYFGFRADTIEVPTKTKQIARIVPEQPLYASMPWSALVGGVLPFGSVCIELFFIMSALWLHQYFYMMGFLMAVLFILVATCSMVSIVMCYLQLCGEDHRWWWKSFWNCATAGVYLFLYALWFLSSKLDLIGFLPILVYLTYMSMISIAFGLLCGAIGFYSCFWFTKKIYGAVKVD